MTTWNWATIEAYANKDHPVAVVIPGYPERKIRPMSYPNTHPVTGEPYDPTKFYPQPGWNGDATATAPVSHKKPKSRKAFWGTVLGIVAVFALCTFGIGSVAALLSADDPKPGVQRLVPVTPEPTSAPETSPRQADPTEEPTPTEAANPEPTKFSKLSKREWSKIARDPESHVGKAIVVYGSVTQFDQATGPSAFRANVGGVNERETWEYETNSVLAGTEKLLEDLAPDDEFRAEVVVVGSFEYESLMGETAAVQLSVRSIKRL